MTEVNGQCLCGDVQFETGDDFHVDACHCKMCQRWAGGVFIGVDFRANEVTLTKDKGLKWFDSSDWAKRGFCSTCGSSLFYRLKEDNQFWAVCAGTLDIPPGHKLGKEIFIDEKPDYFSLAGNHDRLTGAEFFAQLQDSNND